jgi:indole-3-glycerol phosphate synthase
VSHLEKILESTRRRLDALKLRRPSSALESEAAAAPAPRRFMEAVGAEGISLIAEIKRRSPSAGAIKEGADPTWLAAAYQAGGARAISVLTEPEFFGGSLEDLAAARGACRLPVLRKDFIVDPRQVLEARASGADAVLLIVAALPDDSLMKELSSLSAELGMAALVEVHDEGELERAVGAGATLVGVNQRNLVTFEVDRGLAARMRKLVPEGVLVVAESGITSRDDVKELEEAGVDAILVGEALMRAPDPAEAAADLLALD